jgi:hypothetical protein
MQTQPKPEAKVDRVRRARQARNHAEDAFKGGAPPGKLSLKGPWTTGTGRLWAASAVSKDNRES